MKSSTYVMGTAIQSDFYLTVELSLEGNCALFSIALLYYCTLEKLLRHSAEDDVGKSGATVARSPRALELCCTP